MSVGTVILRGVILALALLAAPAVAQQSLQQAPSDPSFLTTQQLIRELQSQSDLFRVEIDGMLRALELVQERADAQPTPGIVEERRQADLRFLTERIAGLDRLMKAQLEAASDLSQVQVTTLKEQAAFDRTQVIEAARVAKEDAKALALTVQQTAENLSGQVDKAAGIATENLATQESRIVAGLDKIDSRLKDLEQFQDRDFGRAGIADPQLIEALAQIQELAKSRDTSTGKGQGAENLWGYLVGGAGFLLALLVFAMNQNKPRREV